MNKIFNLIIVLKKDFKYNIVKYFNLDYTNVINQKNFTNIYTFIFVNKAIFYFLNLNIFNLFSIKSKYMILVKTIKKNFDILIF